MELVLVVVQARGNLGTMGIAAFGLVLFPFSELGMYTGI